MMLKRIVLTLVLLGSAGWCQSESPSAQSPAAWTSLVEKIQPSVVVIETDKGLGSGFVVKSDGTIATNHHVIAGATAVNVKLSSGEIFRRVYLLADNTDRDLALLR